MKVRPRFIIFVLVLVILLTSGIYFGLAYKNGNYVGPEALDVSSSPNPTTKASFSPLASPLPVNESGKIMVVMFHNFVDKNTASSISAGDYTMTFDKFESTLEDLYKKNYRSISLTDYLNNNIIIQEGCIPIIFTFDDNISGQFNLIDDGNGKLTANPHSAVGIIEKFNNSHPDFGVNGIFYISMGTPVFPGKGTTSEKLNYLIAKGFEIGSHTYSHADLGKITSAEKLQQELGENQKKVSDAVPGYAMTSLALPYGKSSKKELSSFLTEGEFQSTKYKITSIMEVGWDPALPPTSSKFNPLSIHRVRSAGLKPTELDLDWWIAKLSLKEQYVSDGM